MLFNFEYMLNYMNKKTYINCYSPHSPERSWDVSFLIYKTLLVTVTLIQGGAKLRYEDYREKTIKLTYSSISSFG